MREERVIALAGALQAAALARSVATTGDADAAAAAASIASVFKIDADSAGDVFGGIASLRLGMQTLIQQLESSTRDLVLTRMLIGVMRVERAAIRRRDVMQALRAGIEEIGRGRGDAATSAETCAGLARLYGATLSTLRPRILVEGDPRHLKDPACVDRIRALLLAAVRAMVLWRQLGGNQLRLFFRSREYAMIARGLLARCTLGGS